MIGIAVRVALIEAVISFSSTNPATAEVISMQSSLTATGREHACPDEPLIFVCKVNGQYIRWIFNSYYRTTFFYDGNVNEVQTVSGQYGVQAILTGNDPIPNSPNAGFKHLTSSLIIETPNSLSGYQHNISCSSDTAMHTHQLKIAETPNMPLNVQMNSGSRVQFSAHPPPYYYTLFVSWDPPDNSGKFDLEHFKIHIMLPEQESYITNGTSMEPEYHVHSDMIPSQNDIIDVTVTAVSKCSQQGLKSHRVEWREGTDKDIMFTKVPDTVRKTERAFSEYIGMNGYKEMITGAHKVILASILTVSVLFSP